MNIKASTPNSLHIIGICIAVLTACAVLFGPVQSKDRFVTVKIEVSTTGLDLSQPAGARVAYARLKKAAGIACTHGMRVDLQPPTSVADCYEKALGDAVRSAHQSQLTIVYLATHTPRDAATYGIEVPVLFATK